MKDYFRFPLSVLRERGRAGRNLLGGAGGEREGERRGAEGKFVEVDFSGFFQGV